MTIRGTITLLTVPLFLVLAAVNGALLYFQEKTEVAHLLGDQALTAAVTSAEFIADMDAPLHILTAPQRARALAATARKIPGLDALYLVDKDGRSLALFPPVRPLDTAVSRRPPRARLLPMRGDAGNRHIVALAPAGPDNFTVARINAEPQMQKLAQTWRTAMWIIAAAGLVAAALAWFVARRITTELDASGAALAGQRPDGANKALTISEAQELADAVRLMTAQSMAADARERRDEARGDRHRTKSSALLAWRRAEFAPFAGVMAGRVVALRLMGEASPGCFFAHGATDDRAMVMLGRCTAPTPEGALANALAARRFLEANWSALPDEECAALARAAFGIEALVPLWWNANEPVPTGDRFTCLTDDANARKAETYARRDPDASPSELLNAIAGLLGASGIFVAMGPAAPPLAVS